MIEHNGQQIEKTVIFHPKPFETSPDFDVLYNVVVVEGAKYLAIVTRPKTPEPFPAILLTQASVTPYQNINLKLFAAMAALHGIERDHPPIIKLIEQYARLFPDEAKEIYTTFIASRWRSPPES